MRLGTNLTFEFAHVSSLSSDQPIENCCREVGLSGQEHRHFPSQSKATLTLLEAIRSSHWMDNAITVRMNGPVAMVQKGWQTRRPQPIPPKIIRRTDTIRASRAETQMIKRQREAPKKRFQFVHTTRPGPKNLEVRRFIRRHVRNEYLQLNGRKETEEGRTQDSQAMGSHSLANRSGSESIIEFKRPLMLGYPTETSIYPIEMCSETHALLSQYLTYASSRMFPIESCLASNPFRSSEWLRFAVTDPAMFHAVLYAGAVFVALVRGRRESKDTIHHQNRTISIIQQRLSDSAGVIADSTLGAISCLALGEAVSGNEGLWRLHMNGLKQMMLSRSNLSSLSPLMLTKLRRSDITGAIDYATTPLLHFERSSNPPTWSIVPDHLLLDIADGLSNVLMKSEIHLDIVSIMVDLAYFAQAIHLATSNTDINLDPQVFSEDLYWIEHSLLSLPVLESDERPIDRACRVGALLYIKGVLQEFPHSATGASILTQRLRQSLDAVQVMEDDVHLLSWLALVGAMSSKNDDRAWFTMYLVHFTQVGGMLPPDETLPFIRFLNLRTAFGKSLDNVWSEILSRRSLMDFYKSHRGVEIST